MMAWPRVELGARQFQVLHKMKLDFAVTGKILWTDVFGDTQSIAFNLMRSGNITPTGLKSHTKNSGELIVINHRLEPHQDKE